MKHLGALLGLLLAGSGAYAVWFMFFSCGCGGARLNPIAPDFVAISSALKSYKLSNGHYPSTEQGLAALVTRADTEPRPEKWIQTLKRIPLDPWDKPYHYTFPSTKDPHDFEIISAGKDGVFGTTDDISSLDD